MKYIKTYEDKAYLNDIRMKIKGIGGTRLSDFGTRRPWHRITIHEVDDPDSHEINVQPTDELTRLLNLGLVTYNEELRRFEYKNSDKLKIYDEIELIRNVNKYNL